ncbi:MAG: DUF3575 domain-containing protein [Phocaeicola sp.]|nr:DUF3575 domain-containing protein [Phocaeicola sp.]MDD7448843.1 DUF3575 domain-containing protein [Prevotellaceae bacterium]MDY5939012.1 DUF3575 domain-containing protein [Phocaeicola sp.]
MRIRLLAVLFCVSMPAFYGKAQEIALKTNMLVDVALPTPNLTVEFNVGKKQTLEVMGVLNPFTYRNNKKMKLWAIQPAWRYWFCSPFNGWFVGVHAHTGQFNVGNYRFPFGIFPAAKEHRYQGWMVGGGVSVGYQWALSKHWGLEFEIGGGYTHFDYERFKCAKCGTKEKSDNKGFLGPTKVAISLVYIIK